MLRTYKINGETFTMTQAENDDRDAEELAYSTAKPLKDWEEDMANTDSIPRWAEDLISGDPAHQTTLDLIAAKKALRATKP